MLKLLMGLGYFCCVVIVIGVVYMIVKMFRGE
jgi:hypothetical protein